MIEPLLALLERINALPLADKERAELMRAAIREHEGAPPSAPPPATRGPRRAYGSITSAIREALAGGAWRRQVELREAVSEGNRLANFATALRDLQDAGELERKEEGMYANGRAAVWWRLAPPAAEDETA